MNDLVGQPGVMHATIHITRKATGKTETYQIVGTPVDQEQTKEEIDGRNSFDSSQKCSD
jgi:hypothetical protein